MNRIFRTTAIVAVLLLGAAGAWACSDDDGDSLTLDEYFAQVDAIDNDTTAEIDAAFEGITDENDVQQFKDAFKVLGPALDDAANDLEAIEPPAEVETEHDALVVELNNYADKANEIADGIDGIEASNPDELFAAIEEQGFNEADDEFTAACLALQQAGADNGIVVDLGCEEESAASAEAEQAVQDVADAWNASDVDAVAALFTDAGLSAVFGGGEPAAREEIVAGLEGEVGSGTIEIREISSETTDSGADVTVLWVSGRVLESYTFALVDDAGVWKIDNQETLPVDPPTGTSVVNVDLTEFSFTFDPALVTSASPVFFEGHNVGTQLHHMVLAKIPADANLDELLASEEENPPGVEEIGGGPPFPPGESGTIALAAPLEPGRYVMVCFLPDTTDPAETPHAFKGMVSDFTVE